MAVSHCGYLHTFTEDSRATFLALILFCITAKYRTVPHACQDETLVRSNLTIGGLIMIVYF